MREDNKINDKLLGQNTRNQEIENRSERAARIEN